MIIWFVSLVVVGLSEDFVVFYAVLLRFRELFLSHFEGFVRYEGLKAFGRFLALL